MATRSFTWVPSLTSTATDSQGKWRPNWRVLSAHSKQRIPLSVNRGQRITHTDTDIVLEHGASPAIVSTDLETNLNFTPKLDLQMDLQTAPDAFEVMPVKFDGLTRDLLHIYTSIHGIDHPPPYGSTSLFSPEGILSTRLNSWVPMAMQSPAASSCLMTFVMTSDSIPAGMITDNQIRTVMHKALSETNKLLRDPSQASSWPAVMSVIFLLIVAQQMGDIETAWAHAQGLLTIVSIRHQCQKSCTRMRASWGLTEGSAQTAALPNTTDFTSEDDADQAISVPDILSDRFVNKGASQYGFKEIYDLGLVLNFRRNEVHNIFFHPAFVAAIAPEALIMICLMQHALMASNKLHPWPQAPFNALDRAINTVFVGNGGICLPGQPLPRMEEVMRVRVQITAAAYGFLPGTTDEEIDLERSLLLHPGIHMWIAMTHGSFTTTSDAKQGFRDLLRRSADMMGFTTFEQAIDYSSDAFVRHSPGMALRMREFWAYTFDPS